MLGLVISILCGLLYLFGGQVWKPFRWWGIGVLVGVVYAFRFGSFFPLLSILTYFIATNAFSYGDNSWTTKLFGKWVSMGLAGLTYGLASFPVLGVYAILQGLVGLVAFLILKQLDDTDQLKNPWQELLRGTLGTILLVTV